MNLKKIKENYSKKGYFLANNIISNTNIEQAENDILSFSELFRKKINFSKFKKKINSFKTLDVFLRNLEKYNKQYLFNFCNLVNKLPSVLNLINTDEILSLSSKVLNENKNNLLIQNPSFLVNMPKNNRILYHWHNAKNSYPKRNLFLNFWVPIISDKKANNGTICLAEKSHRSEYPFLEFKKSSGDKKSSLNQYLIPNSFVSKFKKTNIVAIKGSCLAMHPNLIHSSTLNRTKASSYVLVFKIWSISKDWTLSSEINQKYFNNDDGAGNDITII